VAAAILLFWFCAGYPEAAWNLNLLWAGPVPLIALIWAAAAGKRAGKQTGQPGKSGRGSGAYTGSPNIVAGKTGKSGGVSGGNTGPANIVEGTAKNSLTAPRLLFTVCAVCAGLVAAAGGFGVQSIDPAARILALAVAVRCADRGGLLGIRLFRKVAPGKGAQV